MKGEEFPEYQTCHICFVASSSSASAPFRPIVIFFPVRICPSLVGINMRRSLATQTLPHHVLFFTLTNPHGGRLLSGGWSGPINSSRLILLSWCPVDNGWSEWKHKCTPWMTCSTWPKTLLMKKIAGQKGSVFTLSDGWAWSQLVGIANNLRTSKSYVSIFGMMVWSLPSLFSRLTF